MNSKVACEMLMALFVPLSFYLKLYYILELPAVCKYSSRIFKVNKWAIHTTFLE